MLTVTSADGTSVALDRTGSGPPLILVSGAFASRSDLAPFAQQLAPHFTVLAYDRRGRGESSDTAPYAVEREVEDIEALMAEAGGSAFAFGHSSGAVLALEAAAHNPAIAGLALYEPPFIVDDSRPAPPADLATHLDRLVSDGRRGDAVEYWMRYAVEVPAEQIDQMRGSPMWPALEQVVHTAVYDATIMADTMRGTPLPPHRWSSVTAPALVMDGELSAPFQHHAVDQLVSVLPNAQRRTVAGATHSVAPQVLAPILVEFFAG